MKYKRLGFLGFPKYKVSRIGYIWSIVNGRTWKWLLDEREVV